MDLSGLIFVALAVAWAAYLIPKALRHHDDVVRGRSIDRFSESMRVLARREPVSARMAQLVVTPARAAAAVVSTKPSAASPSPDEQYAARRAAVRKATKRRRRVLTLLLLALVAVTAACADGRIVWTYVAIPAGLLVAWLVACRLMVRKERAWRPVARTEVEEDLAGDPDASTDEQPQPEAVRDPKLWDPVPVTLPTYVSKPAARRTVRTIDLDSTGVWTSGRTEADSALAREADAAEAAERVRRRVSRKDEAGDEAVNS
ncbi:MAG TPA: hypothetical protein VGK78_03515 [Nocardioides sp.]|uniref:divisome protein SepX/GlpR n=1 Tax=Nocardioides sp. TaxID=35761 RepID=UPI002F3E3541